MNVVTDEIFDLVNPATEDLVAGRIYLNEAPENQTYVGPYVIIAAIGGSSVEDLTGGVGLATERFQFSCYAKVDHGGIKTCRAITEEIRVAIQGIAPSDEAVLGSASHEGSVEFYDFDLQIHVRVADFEVMYSEQPTSAPD